MLTVKIAKSSLRDRLCGLAILEKGDQVRKINDRLYLVKAQDKNAFREGFLKVSWNKAGKWTCECRSGLPNKELCEHIHAVDLLLRLPLLSMLNHGALGGQARCPYCGGTSIKPHGSRFNKSGSVRRFMCRECRQTFKDPTTRQDLNSQIALVIVALDLYYKRLSYREIQSHFFQIYGVHKPLSTIRKWVQRFTKLIVSSVKRLGIQVRKGGKWLGDEMVIRVSGKKMHLWNILHYSSRYQIVSLLLKGRGEREAYKVVELALKKTARQKPNFMLTDGLGSYVGALKAHGISHIANVGLEDKKNNNRIERLHGSIRQFVKAKRGLKKNAGLLLDGHSVYYNCIRPHMALNGQTPVNVKAKKGVKWAHLLPVGKPKNNNHAK